MPPSGEALITPARGGKITVDRVTVEFPPGAVASEGLLRLEPLSEPPEAKANPYVIYAFKASLLHPATRTEMPARFLKEAHVTWDYSGLPLRGAKERHLILFALDESKKRWAPLPSRLDVKNKRVTGTTPHFSTLGGGGDELQSPSKPPTMDGFQVDLMTGGARFGYPIEVPRGAGGMTPKIELGYSSTALDVMNNSWLDQGVNGDNDSPSVQASWVGAGWDLDMGYVSGDSTESTGYPTSIAVNGVSDKLVLKNPYGNKEFRTERDSFWKIVWHESGASNRSGKYVEAWDRGGTCYRFGYNTDSECHDGNWPYKYLLDRVEDTRGNYMTLSYYTIQQTTYWDESNQYDQQVYLAQIDYSGNSQTSFAPKWKVVFNRRDRDDFEDSEYHYRNEYCLDSIDVKRANDEMVRKYVFGYDYGNAYWYEAWSSSQVVGRTKLLLTSITVCDSGATAGVCNGSTSGSTLPSTSFTYHEGQSNDPNPKKNLQIATGQNGYGGTITYAYNYGAAVELPIFALNCHARVTSKTMEDGRGGSSTYSYDYGTLRQTSTSFWGHLWAKEIDPAGHWSTHYFYVRRYGDVTDPNDSRHQQNGKSNADIFIMRGRKWKQEAGASGSSSAITWELLDWQNQKTGDLSGDPDMWFVYLAAQDSFLYAPGSYQDRKRKRVEYVYDDYGTDEAMYEGYGNVVSEYHYGDMDGSGSERRSVHRRYDPNTTAWIMGMVSWENHYQGIVGNIGGTALKTQIINYYDGHTSYGTPPDRGLLTKQEKGLSGQLVTATQYAYDSYGNRTSVTDPNGKTTDMVYESTYHTYPGTTTYPAVGGAQRMTESRVFDERWGKPTSVTDANSQATSYAYDDFGRLIAFAKPGDSLDLTQGRYDKSTRGFVYYDTASPYHVLTSTRKVASGPSDQYGYHYAHAFYDGLGREIQRYSDGVNSSGGADWIEVNTHYNSRGLKEWETAPFYLVSNPGGSFNSTAWNDTSKPRIQYQYDALRRPATVTNPDSTQRTTAYSGWDTTQTDENGHKKVQQADAFGRLTAVHEYTGTGTTGDLYSVYGTTTYGYDVMDNLTGVTDTTGTNPFTMTYDTLGRKTGMTDPDMGSWGYQYDYNGNLTRQQDARGSVVKFGYDELNRLRRKTYWTAGSPDTADGNWVDVLAVTNTIGIYDIAEIRAAINANRVADALANIDWQGLANEQSGNRTFIAGRTTVRAVHFNEMRDAIKDLPNMSSKQFRQLQEQGAPSNLDTTRCISVRDPQDLRDWVNEYEGANSLAARVYFRYDNYTDGVTRSNAKGRRTEMWDASGHTVWQYDARGRVAHEDRYVDGKVYATSYQYDAMDRVTKTTYPDEEEVNSAYNGQLLLDSMAGTSTYVATGTRYNALGQPATVNYGNSDTVTMAYDSTTSRLTSITAPSVSLSYLYFPNGNISRITDGSSTDFTYDALDRLKTASGVYSASYSYDQIGNITSKTEGSATHSYSYTGTSHKHAPVSVTLNGGSADSYTYDANGNLTARSGLTLKYDAENRLVKVSNAGGYVARFIYDGDGKRVKRVDNNGTVIYVGPHYERNVGTGSDTSDTVTKMYWAQLGPVRRMVAVRKGTALTYLHHDHLGSTKKLNTDSTAFKYYPFGSTYQEPANPPTDNLYTGQKRDLSTGLYYYGARYLDVATGRFTQPDSIVPQPGNPQSLNRYSYCQNNPLKYTDPAGHDLMIVPGLGAQGDYDNPIKWKSWIMAYKGWTTEAEWYDWYGKWTASGADRGELVRQYGINLFNWNAVPGGNVFSDTAKASQELNRQMSGMFDITVLGHSKGGAAMKEFILQARDNATLDLDPFVTVRRFVFIDAAIGIPSQVGGLVFGIRPHPGISTSDTSAEIISINNWLDPVGGAIYGARSYDVIGWDGDGILGPHGLKSYLALEVFRPAGAFPTTPPPVWGQPGSPAAVPAPTPVR